MNVTLLEQWRKTNSYLYLYLIFEKQAHNWWLAKGFWECDWKNLPGREIWLRCKRHQNLRSPESQLWNGLGRWSWLHLDGSLTTGSVMSGLQLTWGRIFSFSVFGLFLNSSSFLSLTPYLVPFFQITVLYWHCEWPRGTTVSYHFVELKLFASLNACPAIAPCRDLLRNMWH